MKSVIVAIAGALAAVTTACSADTAASGDLGPATGAGDQGWPFAVEAVDEFDEPWALAFLPGRGDLLVTERSGTLHLRDADSGERVEVEGTPAVVDARHYGYPVGQRAKSSRPPTARSAASVQSPTEIER